MMRGEGSCSKNKVNFYTSILRPSNSLIMETNGDKTSTR